MSGRGQKRKERTNKKKEKLRKSDGELTMVVKGVELFAVTFMIGDDGGNRSGRCGNGVCRTTLYLFASHTIAQSYTRINDYKGRVVQAWWSRHTNNGGLWLWYFINWFIATDSDANAVGRTRSESGSKLCLAISFNGKINEEKKRRDRGVCAFFFFSFLSLLLSSFLLRKAIIFFMSWVEKLWFMTDKDFSFNHSWKF